MQPRLTAILAVALCAAACSHAPKAVFEGESDYFGSSKVKRYRLANGLKVLVLEDHSAPTFAYQTWFNVGSRDEEKGLTGLAHLFEHMMFKATKNLKDGEFDKQLESAGAEGENAFTSRDYTGYVQSLPASKLDLIARLEAERMVNLLVDTQALDKEREVVQNERRFRNENSPDGQLYERLYELAYTKHSYHWPVIGYDSDLRNAKSDNCRDFYKRFYAPNNATIAVVGDVDAADVIRAVEKYYGGLGASTIGRKPAPREPKQTAERVETKPIKTPVEKLVVGYHIPDALSMDFPAIEVVRNILSTGKSSRLYKALVDHGIASAVDVESAEHTDPGLLVLFVNLQKGRTAREALDIVDREIRRLAKGEVKPDELQRAVSMHLFQLFDYMASNHSKAQFLSFYETVAGKFERGIDLVNALRSVDKKAVARVASTYLSRQSRTVVIGTPEGSTQ